MKFKLSTPAEHIDITFDVNLLRMIEAVQNCNLGLGDLATPIHAGSFVVETGSEISEYFCGELIRMELIPELSGEELVVDASIKVVCSNIQNVTKKLNYGSKETQALMSEVFVIDPNFISFENPNISAITLLADGSVCIAPTSKLSCEIKIQKEPFSVDEIYICYSLTFAFNLYGEVNPYYFIIDPLLKISSGNRPSSIKNE